SGRTQFSFLCGGGAVFRGWVVSGAHDVARGIEILREGMAAFLDLGAAALRPYHWAKIAVLSATAGSARYGLDLLDEALEQVDHSGHRWCEAELYRSKGE